MTPNPSTTIRPKPRKIARVDSGESSTCRQPIEPPWASLPYTVIVEVLKYLSDKEKSRASLTCQNWAVAFRDPSLWRYRHFDFGGSKAKASGVRSVQFVGQHGHCLQEVVIQCSHVTSNTCEGIARRLEPFLNCLQRARLKTLRIKYIELDRFWRHPHLRLKIAQWLVSFLESQTQLKEVEVTYSQFDLLSGVEVLQALAGAAGSSIQNLSIEDFFHSRLDVIQLGTYVNNIKRFNNVQELFLNYCCINDDIVLHWAESLKGTLKKLTIKVIHNEPHTHAISKKSWAQLHAACPNLAVSMEIYDIGPSALVMPLIPPTMPLTRFRYRSGFDDEMELRLSRTFNHIGCHFGRSMLECDLDLDNLQDNVDDAVVNLVTKCELLEYLYIRAIINVQVADSICRMLLNRRTRLKHIELVLREMTYEDSEELLDLRQQMSPVAEERGVTLIMKDALYE